MNRSNTIIIRLILVISYSIFWLTGTSQTDVNEGDWCAFEIIQDNLNSPSIVPGNYQRSNEGQYIIPAVIHIIHGGNEDNISDSQVNSALDKINFRLAAGLGGNSAQIELRKATKDIDGNCTNGILPRK